MDANQQKVELVIQALQERIGQLVSNYETQIAILRAEITQLMGKDDNDQSVKKETE
jgi:hypothetical protein